MKLFEDVSLVKDYDLGVIQLGLRSIGFNIPDDALQLTIAWIDHYRRTASENEDLPLDIVCDLKGKIVALIAEDKIEVPPISEEQNTGHE